MNVGKLLNERAKERPHKIALVARGEKLDFAALNRLANRLAYVLSERGIKCDDKVGLLLPSSSEFVVAYLAVQKVGGVAVPLDMMLPPQTVDEMLDFVDAPLLISSPALESAAGTQRPVIALEKERIQMKGKMLDPPDGDLGVDRAAGDEAAYLYTSGSTGRPKVAVLTHGNLHCFPLVMQEVFAVSSESVYGMLLPMSHVSGPIIVQEMVERGTTLAILNLMTERMSVLQSIQENKISCIWGVMPLYRLLIHEAKMGEFDTRNLRILAVMGMETSVEFMRELSQAFPHTAVIQGYGLTETAGVVIGTPPQEAIRKIKSIGRPVSFMEARIVDAQGKPLPPLAQGEIIMKGPAVMKGYYQNEAATRQRIKDGWLHTGDVGYFDEEGFLYLLGRTDDMIITGGLNVFPCEVEDVLRRHPKVKDAAVVGLPDSVRGAVVKAVIVPSSEITREEILKFSRSHLPAFKCPRIVEFRDELPKTSTGKLSRSALLDREEES